MSGPTSADTITAETVIARLEEAGHTLLSLPDRGGVRLEYAVDGLSSAAPSQSMRPDAPAAAALARMDEALAWVRLIPADRLVLRRIVGSRALIAPLTGRHLFTWRRLARLLGADHRAVQRWHAAGIELIVSALQRTQQR